MEGGNISNVIVEGRTLVNARAFTIPRYDNEKDLGAPITQQHRFHDIDLTALAAVNRACSSLPRATLITTDGREEYLEDLYDELSNGYEHPFKGYACYESDQRLAVQLAWMPNTRVIDIEGKAGVYGVRYLGLPW